LAGAIFVVTAIDRRDYPLSTWRMDWVRQVGPGEKVRFAALTPIDEDWRVSRWEVYAAGEPVVSEAEPKPSPAPDAE